MICSIEYEAVLIHWLYVEGKLRGRGIGDELVSAAFELAKQCGCQYVAVRRSEEYGSGKFGKGEQFFRMCGFTHAEYLSGIEGVVLAAPAILTGAIAEGDLPFGIFETVDADETE